MATTPPAKWRRHPVLYQINTRVWLAGLSRARGCRIDLSNVPEEEVEHLGGLGLDGIWLMGVWAPSPASQEIALREAGLQSEYRRALPDLRVEDVVGSPFAVFDYSVSERLGGEAGLRQLRGRLAQRGLRLMLDFVPNHVAVDHGWTRTHPDYLMQDSDGDGGPGYFTREVDGQRIAFAHGRDPYFPPWTDTAQVNYNSPAARAAMIATLQDIADRCDGVRCDMAMLVTNHVFRRVWGAPRPEQASALLAREFWDEAIAAVRDRHPGFVFVAEVYWDMERELQQQGFDFTYDKRLYDLLRAQDVGAVRDHLGDDRGFQNRMARFIENHDEPRAIDAFGRERSNAAALLIATLPGLRMFHQGQFEGRRTRLPVQLARLPAEERDLLLEGFYGRLLSTVGRDLFHDGEWQLLQPRAAWSGNGSFRNIVAYTWTLGVEEMALVVVNLGDHRSQARIPFLSKMWGGRTWALRELLDEGSPRPTSYIRDGDLLMSEGLYVELEPNGYHFLSVEPVENG